MQIINVGCGMHPTPGARNIDNSLSVSLGKRPALLAFVKRLRLLSGDQLAYAAFCRDHGIERMSCAKLKFPDQSVDVVYTSHMLEHLTRALVHDFLMEAKRVLKPGGILRVAVPDMRLLVKQYLSDGDCDALVEGTLLAYDGGGRFIKHVQALVTGFRGHRWMYDAASLTKLLLENGFTDIHVLAPGETTIPFETGIDLTERAEESLYIECRPAS